MWCLYGTLFGSQPQFLLDLRNVASVSPLFNFKVSDRSINSNSSGQLQFPSLLTLPVLLQSTPPQYSRPVSMCSPTDPMLVQLPINSLSPLPVRPSKACRGDACPLSGTVWAFQLYSLTRSFRPQNRTTLRWQCQGRTVDVVPLDSQIPRDILTGFTAVNRRRNFGQCVSIGRTTEGCSRYSPGKLSTNLLANW